MDFFVSHWWGHKFASTLRALENFAEAKFTEIGKKSADDVVFWICLFAINQHDAGNEVRRQAYFRAALVRHGLLGLWMQWCSPAPSPLHSNG